MTPEQFEVLIETIEGLSVCLIGIFLMLALGLFKGK